VPTWDDRKGMARVLRDWAAPNHQVSTGIPPTQQDSNPRFSRLKLTSNPICFLPMMGQIVQRPRQPLSTAIMSDVLVPFKCAIEQQNYPITGYELRLQSHRPYLHCLGVLDR
jgi:hypothetical protein